LVARKQLGNSPETCPGLGNSPERVSEPYFEGVEGFRASDPSLGKGKGFPSLGNSSDTHMKANPFPRLGNKLGSKLGSKPGSKLGRGRGTHMSVPIYGISKSHGTEEMRSAVMSTETPWLSHLGQPASECEVLAMDS
jgi:hypothetical protein